RSARRGPRCSCASLAGSGLLARPAVHGEIEDDPQRLTAPHQLDAPSDLLERQAVRDEPVEREPAVAVEVERQRKVAFGARRAVDRAEYTALHARDRER